MNARTLFRQARAMILLFAIEMTTSLAQPTVDWLTIGGTPQGADNPGFTRLFKSKHCLALGPGGMIYLAGLFGAPDLLSGEAVLFMHDSHGKEVGRQGWRGAYINAVTVDESGECYLTGYVQDPDVAGVGQKYDFYLAKRAADGTLLWERTGGTLRTVDRTSQDDGQAGNAIQLDSEGAVVVAGRSQGPAVYGAVAFPNTLGGPLLCKYTSDGTLLWARRAEGSRQFMAGRGFGFGYATGMMLDPAGNIIMSGTMTDGRADFGGTVVTIDGYFDHGPFTAKCNPAGEVVWVNTTAAAGAVDRQGNIYASDSHSEPAGIVNDLYKYDTSGSEVWRRTVRGRNLFLEPRATDSAGDPIFIGSFSGTVELDAHVLQNDSLELSASLIAKADTGGQFQWVLSGTSGGLHNTLEGVLVDPSGAIHVAGQVRCPWSNGTENCSGTGRFGPIPLSVQVGGGSDYFLARLAPPAAVELRVAKTASGVALSWPAEATSYVLEAATSLPAVSWATVTNTPTVTTMNERSVQLPVTGTARFFRLRQP